jgi:hypothetical protein
MHDGTPRRQKYSVSWKIPGMYGTTVAVGMKPKACPGRWLFSGKVYCPDVTTGTRSTELRSGDRGGLKKERAGTSARINNTVARYQSYEHLRVNKVAVSYELKGCDHSLNETCGLTFEVG